MVDSPGDTFRELLARAQEGDQRAAESLHARYTEFVRRAVRRRLHERLRPIYDSVDFIQSVWGSFFALRPDRYHFDKPEEFVAFLVKIAQHKVIETYRRQQTAKRDVSREKSLHTPEVDTEEIFANDPTPSQNLMAEESWEQLLCGQSDQLREIVDLLRKGHTRRAIAQRLGVSEVTVGRLLKRFANGATT